MTLICNIEPPAEDMDPRQIINRTNSQEELAGARSRSLRLTAADQKKVSSKQVATIVALLSNLLCNLAAKMNPNA